MASNMQSLKSSSFFTRNLTGFAACKGYKRVSSLQLGAQVIRANMVKAVKVYECGGVEVIEVTLLDYNAFILVSIFISYILSYCGSRSEAIYISLCSATGLSVAKS